MAIRSTNRRGERVLRTGQTGDQLIGAVLVIVIAAAIALIGVDVNESIQEGTDLSDLDGEDVTVTNESIDTVVFDSNDVFFYTVDDANRGATFDDDEQVFNTTGDSQLTEGTDYEWFTANATVRLDNTSAVDNNTDHYAITYNYTEKSTNFNNASDEVGTGFADAMGLVDVVFIVILFAVILGALLAFRR